MGGKIKVLGNSGFSTDITASDLGRDRNINIDGRAAFKNLLVNSNFIVNQYGDIDTAPVTVVNNTYMIDRCLFTTTGGVGTVQRQDAFVNNTPTKILKFTAVDGGVCSYSCKLNPVDPQANRTINLSVWIRTNAGTGARMSMTHSTGGTFIPFFGVPHIWSQITGTLTLSSNNSVLNIDIGMNGDFEPGTYLEIANIQLEYGAVPSDFEERPYDIEKYLCGLPADNALGYNPIEFSKPKTGFKNHLANGDLRTNQHSDIDTAPVVMADGTYQIDRFESEASVVTGVIQRFEAQTVNNRVVNSIRATATSSAIGLIGISQKLENFYKGETKTFGVWVKSNLAGGVKAGFYDGVSWKLSEFHTGAGAWEFLSVTGTIDANATELQVAVKINNGFFNPLSISTGNYIETTMWQLENGSIATDFETIPYELERTLTGIPADNTLGYISIDKASLNSLPVSKQLDGNVALSNTVNTIVQNQVTYAGQSTLDTWLNNNAEVTSPDGTNIGDYRWDGTSTEVITGIGSEEAVYSSTREYTAGSGTAEYAVDRSIAGNIRLWKALALPEIMINGDFTGSIANWVQGVGGIITLNNDRLEVSQTTGDYGSAYQEFTTVIGETYKLTGDYIHTNGAGRFFITSTPGTSGASYISGVMSSDTSVTATFVATTTITYVNLYNYTITDDTSSIFDNISIKLDHVGRTPAEGIYWTEVADNVAVDIITSKIEIKSTDSVNSHNITDCIRGLGKYINSDTTDIESDSIAKVLSVTSTGLTLGTANGVNAIGLNYVLSQYQYNKLVITTNNHGKRVLVAFDAVANRFMALHVGSGLANYDLPTFTGSLTQLAHTKALDIIATTTRSGGKVIGDGNTIPLTSTGIVTTDATFHTSSNVQELILGTSTETNKVDTQHITYGEGNSDVTKIWSYFGEGAGQKLETDGREASRFVAKSKTVTYGWAFVDNVRADDGYLLYLDANSIIGTTDHIDLNADNIEILTLSQEINWDGGEYIGIAYFNSKNTTGGGSYVDQPTDTTNFQIVDGQLMFADGYFDNHALNTGESFVGTNTITPTNGWAQGVNFIKRVENTEWISTLDKPIFGTIPKRTIAGYNPDIFNDGKWYPSSNGSEQVNNGDLSDGITGWTISNTVSVDAASQLVVDGTVLTSIAYQRVSENTMETGKTYLIEFDVISIEGAGGWSAVLGATNISLYNTSVGKQSFIATKDSHVYAFQLNVHSSQASKVTFDNITMFEIDIELDAPYDTPITYIDGGVEADVSSNLVEYRADELVVPDINVNNIEVSSIISEKAAINDLVVQDGFDLGQKWVNVTADRAFGVEQFNDTGKPIKFIIYGTASVVDGYVSAVVNDEDLGFIARYPSAGLNNSSPEITVGVGETYTLTGTNFNLNTWMELI